MLEMENGVAELKSAFGGFICTLDTAKESISESENMSIETYLIEMQRGKRIKKLNRTSKNRGTVSNSEIHITAVSQETWKMPNRKKFPKIYTWAYGVAGRWRGGGHIIFKLEKRKTLKETKKKRHLITRKGKRFELYQTSFQKAERRGWSEILKAPKEKPHQPRILKPENISLKSEGEINPFSDK